MIGWFSDEFSRKRSFIVVAFHNSFKHFRGGNNYQFGCWLTYSGNVTSPGLQTIFRGRWNLPFIHFLFFCLSFTLFLFFVSAATTILNVFVCAYWPRGSCCPEFNFTTHKTSSTNSHYSHFLKMANTSINETINAINRACSDKGGVYSEYSCKTVSWDDVSRGTVGGGLSCWGSNITDTYLKSKDGRQLYTVRSDRSPIR